MAVSARKLTYDFFWEDNRASLVIFDQKAFVADWQARRRDGHPEFHFKVLRW